MGLTLKLCFSIIHEMETLMPMKRLNLLRPSFIPRRLNCRNDDSFYDVVFNQVRNHERFGRNAPATCQHLRLKRRTHCLPQSYLLKKRLKSMGSAWFLPRSKTFASCLNYERWSSKSASAYKSFYALIDFRSLR